MRILSYFAGIDPAAAVVVDGRVAAYVEEERLIRYKHAPGVFPIRSVKACLKLAGLGLGDVDLIVQGWDAPRYGSGAMASFYERVNERYPPGRRDAAVAAKELRGLRARGATRRSRGRPRPGVRRASGRDPPPGVLPPPPHARRRGLLPLAVRRGARAFGGRLGR